MSTTEIEQTMLAKDALWRDLARHSDSVDDVQRQRIKMRMIDTVMDLDRGITAMAAIDIVDHILTQDPSSASQLRIKGVDA